MHSALMYWKVEKLKNARDLFLFACNTGAAYIVLLSWDTGLDMSLHAILL